MAALSTIALGALAAGTVKQSLDARSSRKAAQRQAEKEETRAKEANALETTRIDAGAEVQLGTTDPTLMDATGAARKRTNRKTALPAIGTVGASASSVGGL